MNVECSSYPSDVLILGIFIGIFIGLIVFSLIILCTGEKELEEEKNNGCW